jgi:hypothetical protein
MGRRKSGKRFVRVAVAMVFAGSDGPISRVMRPTPASHRTGGALNHSVTATVGDTLSGGSPNWDTTTGANGVCGAARQ